MEAASMVPREVTLPSMPSVIGGIELPALEAAKAGLGEVAAKNWAAAGRPTRQG